MARSTLTLLVFLIAVASLLTGVFIGRNASSHSQVLSSEHVIPSPTAPPSTTPTVPPRPTRSPLPSPGKPTANPSRSPRITGMTSLRSVGGISTFTDRGCGIILTFPESYVQQKTKNEGSNIFTDPNDPRLLIAATCQTTIPKPPVAAEDTESTSLDGQEATLYHDKNPDGSPRDEIIVRHPTLDQDIIIAGWGDAYQQALSSFRFLR